MSKIIALKKLIDSHFEKLEELINNYDNDKTFYIYTTGIASWAENNLINIWKDCRYKNIINQIPKQFNNIFIEHYDPIIFIPQEYDDSITNEQNVENQKNKLEEHENNTISIISKIKQILLEQDKESLITDKKTKQIFIKEYFDFSSLKKTKKHYIIFDFAHLFYFYLSDEKYIITFKNSYKNIESQNFYNNNKNDEILDLNCIYIPYSSNCVDFQNKIKYFNYDHTTRKITSYIELFLKLMSSELLKYNIIKKQFKLDKILDYDHIDQFINILDKILYIDGFDQYIQQQSQQDKKNIYKYIDINKNNINNKLFEEFFEKLFNKENSEIFNIEKYQIFQNFKNEFGKG